MRKNFWGVVVEKYMMIIVNNIKLKRYLLDDVLYMFKKKLRILNKIIVLLCFTLLSTFVFSNDKFNVKLECNSKNKEYCNVVKVIDDKKTVILDSVRHPNINQINNETFHISGSCGSPCQYHIFLNNIKSDETSEFVTINNLNQCLIETDSINKKIYARFLFNKDRKLIANLKSFEFKNVIIDVAAYNSFQNDSFFDSEGRVHLIAMLDDFDESGNRLYFNKIINKPCGDIK